MSDIIPRLIEMEQLRKDITMEFLRKEMIVHPPLTKEQIQILNESVFEVFHKNKTMTIIAANDCLWVCRQEAEAEKSGILIPDSAKKALHRGEIISVGELVSDSNSRLYEVAIFNKSAGFEIEENGITYLILKQMDIVGYDKRKP